MNGLPFRTVLLAALFAAGAGVLWWLQSRQAALQDQLATTTRERDGAQQTMRTQNGQIDTLLALQRQQAADLTAQQTRLAALSRAAADQTTQLETLLHDNPDAQRWGDTRLPAAVARLLDTTTQPAAGPAADRAALPTGGDLPTAGQPSADQP